MTHLKIAYSDVEVVMATYNGAKYLDVQIKSILQQLHNGKLLIHDDGSTDGTVTLLSVWTAEDKRIINFQAPTQHGASANFSYLLGQTTAAYVFCADQDDIWHENKLQFMLGKMKFYESVYGDTTPLLIHSDLRLIQDDNNLISPSMWKYQNLDPSWGDDFRLLLSQNVVTGCTVLVNRALLDKALPVPTEATMHDHWLALVACGQGKIIWLDDALVDYRQHNSNEVGAHKYDVTHLISRMKDLIFNAKLDNSTTDKTYSIAEAYVKRFPGQIESVQAREFAELSNANLILRPLKVFRGHFLRKGLGRTLSWAIQPKRYLLLTSLGIKRLFRFREQ